MMSQICQNTLPKIYPDGCGAARRVGPPPVESFDILVRPPENHPIIGNMAVAGVGPYPEDFSGDTVTYATRGITSTASERSGLRSRIIKPLNPGPDVTLILTVRVVPRMTVP